nr:MAG TPA: hypothetical protein [Caudoviricetes sp.]
MYTLLRKKYVYYSYNAVYFYCVVCYYNNIKDVLHSYISIFIMVYAGYHKTQYIARRQLCSDRTRMK